MPITPKKKKQPTRAGAVAKKKSRSAITAEIKKLSKRAEKAREDEDHEASRKALEQILELNPDHADSIWWMADFWHTVGSAPPALKFYRRYLKIHPGDPEAIHMIASLGGGRTPKRASNDYVSMHFDSYADDFEKSLISELKYQAPKLVARAIAKVRGKKPPPADILDLGCGTGLVGVKMKPLAKTLTGVDLARKMVQIARKRGIYDKLAVAEVTKYLRDNRNKFDIIVNADVMIYFGDITALFRAAAAALRPGGLYAFSVESHPKGTYTLTDTGRYKHNPKWLRTIGKEVGLIERHNTTGRLRFEVGKPVPGYYGVMEKVDKKK
jgi:predicted TPR repeat methyltransferase